MYFHFPFTNSQRLIARKWYVNLHLMEIGHWMILVEGNLWSSQNMTLITILKTKLMTRSSCHDHQHLPSSKIRKTPNLSKNARFRDWYLVKRASWWSADKSTNKPTNIIKLIFRQMYRWCRRWLLETNKQIQHNDSNEC